MQPTELLLNADADLLAKQIQAWSAVMGASQKIALLAAEQQWQALQDLAEDRDKQVLIFFADGVCREILPQVSDDLEEIKRQHQQILVLLQQQQSKISAEEDNLLKIRKEISESPPLQKQTKPS